MDDSAIIIKNVSKDFKLPHEKYTSVKSLFVNFYRRKRIYEVQHALKDVSFEIKSGEFFGVVGRNGSGKSTMLKLMAGIYTPTRGDIAINGSLTPFIELGVGFNKDLTGRENVFLNGALLGFNRKQMQSMYKDIVEFAELEKFMDQKLKNYSSGMQVRLAFSIAIRAQSDILLLDEVLAVGDAAFQRKCLNYFEQLKAQRKTVILVTHDMNSVRKLCSRAALVTAGKLEYIGAPEHVAELYDNQNAEGVRLSDKPAVASGLVEIEELVVTGQKRSVFSEKDSVKIKFVIQSTKRIEAFAGLQIIRQDGQFIAGITSQLQIKPKIMEPGKKIVYEFIFPAEQLIIGTYLVDGMIFEVGNNQPAFYKNAMAEFKIDGNIHGWGTLNLTGSWKEKRNE
jgi:ABC-2 type transport system ATP-binding protein